MMRTVMLLLALPALACESGGGADAADAGDDLGGILARCPETYIPCTDCFESAAPLASFDGCNNCDVDGAGVVGECTMRFCFLFSPGDAQLRPSAECGDRCMATNEEPPADYAGDSACLTPCGWCQCTADGPNRCESTNAFCYGCPIR